MIQPIGFLDVSQFAATFVMKYRQRLSEGLLYLRDEIDGEPADLPILSEWRQARSLLKRIETEASRILAAKTELGKAWLEFLPGGHGTPWTICDDDYGQAVIRTRTCIIPCADATSYSGKSSGSFGVGWVNQIEHRILCSEVNWSTEPRTHLIVDVFRPETPETA